MNIQDIGRLCRGTPTITVQDNRGLIVREIQYNRTRTGDELDTRITRHTYNAAGHLQSSIDPRFFKQLEEATTPEEKAKVPRNFNYFTSLSGQQLRIDSVDAGSRMTLTDISGAPMLELDERGTTRRFVYEDALHRPTAVIEQNDTINNGVEQVSERFVYGESEPGAADNNLIGQLVRHYDNTGLWETKSISLTGQPLCEIRRLLLSDTDDSDWQGTTETDWKAFLEPDVVDKRYTTSWLNNALGESLQQTDAMGNQQRSTYYVSGRLQASYLTLSTEGQTEQTIVSGLEYSAHGQKLREVAGNGVTTEYRYDDKTLRLVSMKTTRPPKANRPTLLQDLRYSYDPVGNILAIQDQLSTTRFYKNQQVSAENTYTYDALYQLISATGRENVTNRQSNSSLPTPAIPISTDSSQLRHYHRTYCYDRGGNLEQIKHLPTNATGYTTTMVVSDKTNRAVQQNNLQSIKPEEVDDHFDVHGNLKTLEHSKKLSWARRDQLKRVQITANQHEVYQYAVQGQRTRKTFMDKSTQKKEQVIYLPGLEIRHKYHTGQSSDSPTEALHVLTVGEAGRAQVRVMHWESGKPAEADNGQLRYSLDNHLGSSNLELNQQADIITREEYYPFGGTAAWSAKSSTEAKYKTVRYSGKELDATGLYYYGYRYYASWMGRWLNPDPSGTVDGLNLFRMVRNNPVTLKDPDGRAPKPNNFVELSPGIAGMSLFTANTDLINSINWLHTNDYRSIISIEDNQIHDTINAIDSFNKHGSGDFKWRGSFLADWHAPSVKHLSSYVRTVNELQTHGGVVTHCWGGAGRTGVFLAAKWLYDNPTQRAHDALRHIRQNYRIEAIEMKAQYNALARYSDFLKRGNSKKISDLTPYDMAMGHWDPSYGDAGLAVDPGHNGDMSHSLPIRELNKVMISSSGIAHAHSPYTSKKSKILAPKKV
ncbi:RHS repeat-associated core domain-containing protein [Vibrio aestuarianus]|uniref:RHS repeat-associated core domain-containing protein n=1 Tax=Vibrio aestuarianus TaxID=28171 RepID=UPI00237C6303|nr:RHS repeat-associated core domain-containing protein [Vibrio aestuarianus]MDE1333696.1 hypothetical protein [Vibrio aestuarianus]